MIITMIKIIIMTIIMIMITTIIMIMITTIIIIIDLQSLVRMAYGSVIFKPGKQVNGGEQHIQTAGLC